MQLPDSMPVALKRSRERFDDQLILPVPMMGDSDLVVLLAARLGDIRLIDNISPGLNPD